jgi:3-hydroxybutyryl-CoA dehydrogenase
MSNPGTVVVVGAGRMGSGIAHAFLTRGASVELHDVDEAAVSRGRDAIRLALERAHERGTADEPIDQAMARLQVRVGLDNFGSADLAIEAVPEIPDLKRRVLRQLSDGLPRRTVIATNTSSISIGELSSAVTTPDRFLGMHFFNPVPVSKLVEIVRGSLTGAVAVDLAAEWTRAIGKESIVVADVPGFATSRLGVAIGLEAIRMLEEGVGSADDIDRGMTLGYGFPVGPLRLTDIVGLDVRLEIAEYLHGTLGARFEPPALLRQNVAAGRLGRKSGSGFYAWPEG